MLANTARYTSASSRWSYQCANHQGGRPIGIRLVVLALGDEIPLLVGRACAVHE